MAGTTENASASSQSYEYEWRGISDIWKFPKHRLEELEARSEIHWPEKVGGVPRRKVYLKTNGGVPVQDVVTDIMMKRKSTEYPTKKPDELLRRVIVSSTRKGDLVLDPFCGCGTSILAAHKLNRRWVGIDISGHATDEIQNALRRFGLHDGKGYDLIEGRPDTMAEYRRLTPYDKQDWLIRRLGGLPNPRKSGDLGVDGDLGVHIGIDANGRDQWGRVIFSVKTGKQRKPQHVRELLGTMNSERAQIGVLILDVEPTDKMEEAAKKAKQFKYQQQKDIPPKEYDRVQILTAYEIIEGAKIDCPPTMQIVKQYRDALASERWPEKAPASGNHRLSALRRPENSYSTVSSVSSVSSVPACASVAKMVATNQTAPRSPWQRAARGRITAPVSAPFV